MPQIRWKVKPQILENGDVFVRIPAKFKKHHCDMDAFRRSPKYGPYANSDLFPSILMRIRKQAVGIQDGFFLSKTPQNITVEQTGFLWNVTLDV